MIEVVKTDAEQPYHVRISSSGNNDTLLIGENLNNEEDALNQIIAAAWEFGVETPVVVATDGYYSLSSADQPVRTIRFVDEVEGTTRV